MEGTEWEKLLPSARSILITVWSKCSQKDAPSVYFQRYRIWAWYEIKRESDGRNKYSLPGRWEICFAGWLKLWLSSDLHAVVTGIVCTDCVYQFWLSRGQRRNMQIAWFFQIPRCNRAVSSSENGFISFLLAVAILFFQRFKVDEINRIGKGRIRKLKYSSGQNGAVTDCVALHIKGKCYFEE